jgi:hypothetical protein
VSSSAPVSLSVIVAVTVKGSAVIDEAKATLKVYVSEPFAPSVPGSLLFRVPLPELPPPPGHAVPVPVAEPQLQEVTVTPAGNDVSTLAEDSVVVPVLPNTST